MQTFPQHHKVPPPPRLRTSAGRDPARQRAPERVSSIITAFLEATDCRSPFVGDGRECFHARASGYELGIRPPPCKKCLLITKRNSGTFEKSASAVVICGVWGHHLPRGGTVGVPNYPGSPWQRKLNLCRFQTPPSLLPPAWPSHS